MTISGDHSDSQESRILHDSSVLDFYEKDGRIWHCADKNGWTPLEFLEEIIFQVGKGTPIKPLVEAIRGLHDVFVDEDWNEITDPDIIEFISGIIKPATCYEQCGQQNKPIPGCKTHDEIISAICSISEFLWHSAMATVKENEVDYEADRSDFCRDYYAVLVGWGSIHRGLDPRFEQYSSRARNCSVSELEYFNTSCDEKKDMSDLDQGDNNASCFLPLNGLYDGVITQLNLAGDKLKDFQCSGYTYEVSQILEDLKKWQ